MCDTTSVVNMDAVKVTRKQKILELEKHLNVSFVVRNADKSSNTCHSAK